MTTENKTTHGEVSWDDKNAGRRSEYDNKGNDIYLRLKEGPNTIRLVTNPQQYVVHSGVKREGDKGFGTKVKCSKTHGSCPLCDLGFTTSLRWYLGVIDRETNSYKILDIGPGVFFDIKALNDGKWGNPQNYNLDLIKNSKSKDPQHFYSVQPLEKAPLSASDQKLVDEHRDMDALARMIAPPTPDKVQERLEKIMDGGTLAMPVKKEKPIKKAEKSSASVKTVVSMTDDEDDDLFPSYENSTANS